MLRGLMVVLALAATVARAQEAKAASSSGEAAPAKAGEREIVLASRTTPEAHPPPLARSAGSRDAGADAGTVGRETIFAPDAVIATYLEGGTPVVRSYQEPASEPQGTRDNSWEQAPFVRSITRCGRLYIFQVWSRSKDTWVVDRARLEGPKGETLQVNALHFNQVEGGWDINVIKAEAPPGTKFSKLKFHLTGQDGRVAQPEARELP